MKWAIPRVTPIIKTDTGIHRKLNNLTTIEEIEFIIDNLCTKKTSSPMSSMKHFKNK